MKTRAIISDDVLHVHGGVVPILNKIKSFKLPELIKACLGERPKQAKYSYEDAIISWIMTMYCYGFRLLNIENTHSGLSVIPDLNIPSHDTIGRMMKKLSTKSETIIYKNPKNPNDGVKSYLVNENDKLNDLLVQANKKMGLLKEDVSYILDIDATIIESGVCEANRTYKTYDGFTSMVCMINKTIVYVSLRSGNSGPHYRKLECLISCLDLLKKYNINVDTVRIDGAGYKGKIMDYLESKGIKFVIGANWSKGTYNRFENAIWKKRMFQTSTHVWDSELSTFNFSLEKSHNTYNMCAIRIKKDSRTNDKEIPTKWHLGEDGYYYKFVITNQEDANAYDIHKFYNERGTSEKNFDSVKNDFGWRILPFSKLNENLVYMLITAFANNVYQGLLKFFSEKLDGIEPSIRLNKFYETFICVIFSFIDNRYTFYSKQSKNSKGVIFRSLV